ncbi:MAG: acyl-CoA dehydrogenase family protein [Actinomycetota bacterium]|nr:acyl-CoA dehydrogenase family protein [Actinomycetota bacterium]
MQGPCNQPPPLEGCNLFLENRPLAAALEQQGAAWARERATALGESITGEPLEWGRLANENPPRLRTHDRFGERIDEVEFHPAWHSLMRMSIEHGVHALSWREQRAGAHVARAALFFLMAQVEAGHGCPISMTHAAVAALRNEQKLAAKWEPLLLSLAYDPGLRSPAEKRGILCGMAMTEKQGGSDVRANTTTAAALGGGEYALTGHKWFCSAPMCDSFLVLAQAEGGLSCFLLPRVLADGTRNGFRIQRLKDKLGDRSNASSEIELDRAWALLVGEEGRGVSTIITMVNLTRLDCVLGTAAAMRAGVEQATHHAAHRSAFGKLLAEQPLMRNVLADLCVESEAATLTALRLAGAYDRGETALARIGTAVAKYWVCKRGPGHAADALECLGGNGYVEESGMPRLYRQQPLQSIWEGSGNVVCLDVLRALRRMPETREAFLAECREAAPAERRLRDWLRALERELRDQRDVESRARRLVERMGLALQASLLVRYGDAAVTDAFCASRLTQNGGFAYGTLPRGVDAAAIVERHRPRL